MTTQPSRRGTHDATLDALVDAVTSRDRIAVEEILDPLDRLDLEAIAIILADRAGHPVTETKLALPHQMLDYVVRAAALAFHVSPEQITSDERRRDITDARQVVCYAARLLGFSQPRIGKHIGRDHSTVFNACSRVGEDRHLREVAMRIAEALGWDRNAAGGAA